MEAVSGQPEMHEFAMACPLRLAKRYVVEWRVTEGVSLYEQQLKHSFFDCASAKLRVNNSFD